MNCPEDKPCVYQKDGQQLICRNCGRTRPPENTHRAIRAFINRSVRAQEWGGINYPKEK